MPDVPSPPFAVVLLAGGFSRRMGCDKARLVWREEELWRFQLEKLTQLGAARCLISCREEQKLHEGARLPQVEWFFDPPGDESGPLGAVGRLLAQADMPLIVLAVDMPCLSTAFLRDELVSSMPTGLGCFFQSEHGFEPLAGCYVPAMLPVITAHLRRGQLSLQKCLGECLERGLARVRSLRPDEQALFVNMNTPSEWGVCQLPIPA